MPGFVAQNGAQALHFDLGDALGRFGAATGRVDERYGEIFGRPPESLSAAGVEFGDRDGEGQSDVAFDGADLEPAAGSPVGAALDGVNFESADGRVSGFVVSAPGQRVPGADASRLLHLGQKDVVAELRLGPVDEGGSVACLDPNVAGAADDLWRDLVLVESSAAGAGEAEQTNPLATSGRHDALHSALDPVVSAPLEQKAVEEHRGRLATAHLFRYVRDDI